MFAGLLVACPDSVLQTPAVFTSTVNDITYGLVSLFFFSATFYVVLFRFDLVRLAGARLVGRVKRKQTASEVQANRS